VRTIYLGQEEKWLLFPALIGFEFENIKENQCVFQLEFKKLIASLETKSNESVKY